MQSVVNVPDGQHITSGSKDRTIRTWNSEISTAVGKPLEGHIGEMWSVACSPNGKLIISGSNDKAIRIWNTDTGYPVGKALEGHIAFVLAVIFLSAHCLRRTIRICETKTGAVVSKPQGG